MDLAWIAAQQPRMEVLLEQWVNINSFTGNLSGLIQMANALVAAFESLEAKIARVSLPPRNVMNINGEMTTLPLGQALHMTKRPNAPFRLFLGGHMDTVHPPESPFRNAERLAGNRLRGPGAADMKGGLVILLTLLQALEKSPLAEKIGWEVLINPDEEIGSVGSRRIFAECAQRNHVGLLFEPALPDGAIVSSRKGSATYTIVAKGRSAHAGRDFAAGRNAISALAKFIMQADALTDIPQGTTVNIGQMLGGQAANVVPELAFCRLNVRVIEENALEEVDEKLRQFADDTGEGLELRIHEDSTTPPKQFDEPLFDLLKLCGKELNIPIQWRPSGGACDGNRLQTYGLKNIDSLGVVGGGLHTLDEYVELPSLTERAILAASFVTKLVSNSL